MKKLNPEYMEMRRKCMLLAEEYLEYFLSPLEIKNLQAPIIEKEHLEACTLLATIPKYIEEKEWGGMVERDEKVMLLITQVWNSYLELEDRNSDDDEDFLNAIHSLQKIFAVRSMRKHYPDCWR